ncbi:hypothetical protein PMPD1_2318 [Paramixta manurensis]|uniref:DUF7480 domain-containing protein n=1 Tax=Paramixta manurensis TaxID=2740817 RepID=A0A6M8UPU7_9GAMM|nr:hypothetical protein PMPD1_2318 [Erwiniaceae bacterium PD-1]
MDDYKEGSLRLLTLGEIKLPLLLISSILVTGCPGIGDRLQPDETTSVSKIRDEICFLVPNSRDYQPIFIAINQRNKPSQEMTFTRKPDLHVQNGQLCLPADFYAFPEKGEFIVQYILASQKDSESRRSVVSAFEIANGRVHNLTLTRQEITR